MHYVDNVGEEGREKSSFKPQAIHYSRDSKNMCTGLTTACADAYLVEAALADKAPSATKYDPENDGTPLGSLGVAEHWNNAKDKHYTKIDLVYKVK